MCVTVRIVTYWGGFPVGKAVLQPDGVWACRSLVDPYDVKVETAVADTERKAVLFLHQNRFAMTLKKIRVPQPDDVAPDEQHCQVSAPGQ